MKIYKVGGCIRDELMNIKPKDIDYVVVGSTSLEMTNLGYKNAGKFFPVFFHPETGDEYALARTEISTGPSYTDFKVDHNPDITLEEDLKRRDLTINSIAKNETDEFVDPFDGMTDVKNKVFRMTSPKAFAEDPVRILRLARFAARFGPEWTIDPATILVAACCDLSGLQADRIQKELSRALMEPYPRLFFDTLVEVNALHKVFPEIDLMRYSRESPKYHGEGNTYEHTMLVLTEIRNMQGYTYERAIAALLHDMGKTRSKQAPKFHGHENHLDMVTDFCNKYRCTSSARKLATVFMKNHMKLHNLRVMKPIKIVRLLEQIKNYFPDVLALGYADDYGRITDIPRDMTALSHLTVQFEQFKSVKITQDEILGKSGKQIAQYLERKRSEFVKKQKVN